MAGLLVVKSHKNNQRVMQVKKIYAIFLKTDFEKEKYGHDKKKQKPQGVFSDNQAKCVNQKESWAHFIISINFVVLNSQ